MSSQVSRRVGGGGGGNWYKYSPKDIETSSPSPRSPGLTSSLTGLTPAPYGRVGRGGAGNYYPADSPAAAAVAAANRQEKASGTASAVANAGSRHHALSGRGGAGNWSRAATMTAQERQQAEEEQQRQAALEAQVLQDVEAELAMPAPAYYTQAIRHSKKGPVSGL